MKFARAVERRIERLVDGLSGALFRGRLHPVDIASQITREADLSISEGDAGPTVPNRYTVVVNPSELPEDVRLHHWEREVAATLNDTAAERGWRLEGPAQVAIATDPTAPVGTPRCTGVVAPGLPEPWGQLTGPGTMFPLRYNRINVGRDEGNDVQIGDAGVSRRHAQIWREGGRIWISDLGSANGTFLDGAKLIEPAVLNGANLLTFGATSLTFRSQ